MTDARELTPFLEATLRELFQAERSGTKHPRVEADRLGTSPPGDVMEDIAAHAEAQLERLDEIARARGLTPAGAAKAIGRAFSLIRDNVADLTMTKEQSYRLTLLGVRHGIDLVRVLRELSIAAKDEALRNWTEAWLIRRVELVEQAEEHLRWFVQNPEVAMAPIRDTPLAAITRSALKAFGRLDTGTAAR